MIHQACDIALLKVIIRPNYSLDGELRNVSVIESNEASQKIIITDGGSFLEQTIKGSFLDRTIPKNPVDQSGESMGAEEFDVVDKHTPPASQITPNKRSINTISSSPSSYTQANKNIMASQKLRYTTEPNNAKNPSVIQRQTLNVQVMSPNICKVNVTHCVDENPEDMSVLSNGEQSSRKLQSPTKNVIGYTITEGGRESCISDLANNSVVKIL